MNGPALTGPLSRVRGRSRQRSQGGFTLVETLVAIAISVVVVGPVGAWMMLIFTSQAPAAAGFTDAGQSRLLNTWVTRDVSSAEILQTADPVPPTPLATCTGADITNVLMNLYDLGAEQSVVVYGLGDGPGGSLSLYRWTCDLTAEHHVIDQIEVLRDVSSVTASCIVGEPCRTATVVADLASGHSTSVTASRRSSASALAGFGGSSRPVAAIGQISRTERSPDNDLLVEVSAAASWDPDTPSEDLSYSWSVSGPDTVTLSDATGISTIASIRDEGDYSIQLTVRDPLGNTGQTTLAVPLVNLPPEVDQPDCQPTGEPRAYLCSVDAQDSDTSTPLQGITWGWPIDNSGGSETGSGSSVPITFPAAVTAVPSIQVVVEDQEAGITVRSIELPLGTAPTGPIRITPTPVVSGNGLLQRVANTDQDRVVNFATDPANFLGWELRVLTTDALVDSASGAIWNKTFPSGSTGSFRLLRLPQDGSEPVEEIFRVNAPPTASFVAPSTTSPAPQTLVFNDGSTDDFGISGQSWDFNYGFPGAPITGSGSPVSVTYANPGRYNVVLTVTDVDGLSATDFAASDVGGTPNQPVPPTWSGDLVTLTPVLGATGYVVTFTYVGTAADGSTPCAKTVDINVPASGPFSASDTGNSCANPTETSVSVAVRANSATGPSSIGVVKPTP